MRRFYKGLSGILPCALTYHLASLNPLSHRPFHRLSDTSSHTLEQAPTPFLPPHPLVHPFTHAFATSFRLELLPRSALLRSCMTVYDAQAMMFTSPINHTTNHITTPNSHTISPTIENTISPTIDNSLLFGPLFSASAAICNHSLTIVRVYGLQTLEAWFGCLEPLLPTFSPADLVSIVMPKLRILSSLLVGTWSHPSKTVNHMVSTSSLPLSKHFSTYLTTHLS